MTFHTKFTCVHECLDSGNIHARYACFVNWHNIYNLFAVSVQKEFSHVWPDPLSCNCRVFIIIIIIIIIITSTSDLQPSTVIVNQLPDQ